MKSFSERKGFKKSRVTMQVNSMDKELRNRLWNVLDFYFWHGRLNEDVFMDSDAKAGFTRLWHNFYKEPVDNLRFVWSMDLPTVKARFFTCKWFEVYDFIEFMSKR